MTPARLGGALALTLLLVLGGAREARAQDSTDALQAQIRQSQDRLKRIREERRQLRRQMEDLTGKVHTVNEELRNLEKQIGTSASVVAELEAQRNALSNDVGSTTREMLQTRDDLEWHRAILRRRLEEIYKRGPLGAVQVLLEAKSFGDLISRYKYLHMVALYDRMLVKQITSLESRLQDQRKRLASDLAQVSDLRNQKVTEISNLHRLEAERQRRLRRYRSQESQAQNRLAKLAEDEQKLTSLVAELERARREAERRAGTPSTSTLRTSDLGKLNWPVQGDIVYQFGPQRKDNTTVMREGIGIGADRGTPVHAVEAGKVMYAGPRGLLGQTVILSHGGGYYSLYLYLQNLAVRDGESVASGQVLGHVGCAGCPEGTHMEFQILEPSSTGEPRAVDPVRWLRNRS